MNSNDSDNFENNISIRRKKREDRKKRKFFSLKKFFMFILLSTVVIGIATGIYVYSIVKDIPEINPENINSQLNLNSRIIDSEGKVIETIQAEENRTMVKIDQTPKHLQDAFIAIEDERFWDHGGVDIRSIIGSLFTNLKAGSTVRGGSTITQQLARNVYLSNERRLERKIKEAYIALKIESVLTKKEILEAYMNSIYLGNGSYGVQEGSFTYFSKDVKDLTLSESALLAGITNSPSELPPFLVLKPYDVKDSHKVLGETLVLGEKYSLVYNPLSVERQQIILQKMKDLDFITNKEFTAAMNDDIFASINPGSKNNDKVSSYFVDYVKSQVLKDLKKQGYSNDEASRMLYAGGLNIYSTVDVEMQNKIEDIYKNLSEYVSTGNLSSWRNDSMGNIISESNNIVFFNKGNILDENGSLIFNEDEFYINQKGDITVTSDKLNIYNNVIDINDYFTLDDGGNLLTHELGGLNLNDKIYIVHSNSVTFKASELEKIKDFIEIDESSNILRINPLYFSNDTNGVIQPQSATVILEQKTGELKAIVGGRNFEGKAILNRADTPRQTGSSMKPLGAYLPALDNGFTANTPIDDSPFYNSEGKLWPNNYDFKYRGLTSLRRSVELSINVNAVRAVDTVGIERSMSYLKRMGMIRNDGTDSFVTAQENPNHNDETLSGLALGGLTYGMSPMDMAGAYGSIANGGTFVKPRSYTKVTDRFGKIVIDNEKKKNKVVSEQVAFVLTDVLKSTVGEGLSIAQKARIRSDNESIPIAGKTGTTDENADVWFVGFSPYYTSAVWVGNDTPAIKLNRDSGLASEIFSTIMSVAHEGLEDKAFNKPSGIVERNVCTVSGKLVTSNCKKDPRDVTRKEYFVKGTEPQTTCNMHVSVEIDPRTGLLVNPDCRPNAVINKVFFKRIPAYYPSKNNGILTEDYSLGPPTGITNCNSVRIFPPLSYFFPRNDENNGNDENNKNDSENESSKPIEIIPPNEIKPKE